MFTGIVEETGRLLAIDQSTRPICLSIACQTVMEGTRIGDSIAVNGVCLTVTKKTSEGFTADVMRETLSKSTLGQLRLGNLVNLERAMPADGRFGGHMVSGHIDGTGAISNIQKEENAVWVTITPPPPLLRYIVQKGSIAIDGISLTVAKVTDKSFSVCLIPHTASETTLLRNKVGASVNLECDVVGKYIEKMLASPADTQAGSTISLDFLQKNGF